MNVKVNNIVIYISLLVTFAIAYVWFSLLLGMEQMIDPENIPDVKFVKFGGVMYNLSSPILLAVSILPSQAGVLLGKVISESKSLLVFRKVSLAYMFVASILVVLQVASLVLIGQKYA